MPSYAFVVAETNQKDGKCLYVYDCVADRAINAHLPSLKMIEKFVEDYFEMNRFSKQGIENKNASWNHRMGECFKDVYENAGLNLLRTIDLLTQLRSPVAHVLNEKSTREDLCCFYSVELLTGTPLNSM